ncbi:MAG: hypothetical protein WCG95_00105 [bacterium]
MCFFKSGGSSGSSDSAAAAVSTEKDEAAKKGRLLFTDGENKGQQLNASQGQTIRKVFGN